MLPSLFLHCRIDTTLSGLEPRSQWLSSLTWSCTDLGKNILAKFRDRGFCYMYWHIGLCIGWRNLFAAQEPRNFKHAGIFLHDSVCTSSHPKTPTIDYERDTSASAMPIYLVLRFLGTSCVVTRFTCISIVILLTVSFITDPKFGILHKPRIRTEQNCGQCYI